MMGRHFGQRPSTFWGITDDALAMDVDRTFSLRLLLFDCEKAQREAEALSHPSHGVNAPHSGLPDLSQYQN